MYRVHPSRNLEKQKYALKVRERMETVCSSNLLKFPLVLFLWFVSRTITDLADIKIHAYFF
jgi:hypothetical protein